MRKYKTFCYPESVIRFLDELENKGVLPQNIHITESDRIFTVFYKDKPTRTNL